MLRGVRVQTLPPHFRRVSRSCAPTRSRAKAATMSQEYSVCEVAQNNGRRGQPAWLIVKGCVYDMTAFLQEHPGGEDTILEYAGKDATKAFNEVGHSADAVKQLKLYKIGVIRKECTRIIKNQPAATKPGATKATQQKGSELCCEARKEPHKFFCCF